MQIAGFAPVLAANVGGAIVNMLSVTSFYNHPADARCRGLMTPR